MLNHNVNALRKILSFLEDEILIVCICFFFFFQNNLKMKDGYNFLKR